MTTTSYRSAGTLIICSFLSLSLLLFGCGEQPQDTEEMQPMDETTEETETSLHAALSGGPDGDPEGSGSASVTIDAAAAEVCYEIDVSNIADPTMAHIHRGAAGESGGVVVDFNMPEQGMSGCVSNVERNLAHEIIQNPANFYVNVHNADYPGGAVRGQLMAQ